MTIPEKIESLMTLDTI